MPANKSLYDALSTIKTDKSKVLGLTFGTQEITPGQQFPKAGQSIWQRYHCKT